MSIKTNVYLRRADREDLDTIVGWVEDPDFQFFLYGDPARSPKQIRANIVAMLGRAQNHTLPGGIYFIIESKDHGPVGLVSLQSISWRNRSCSVDLYIGKDVHRNGIMAGIAAYRTLEYAFDELNLHRITAYIYSFNTRSWRLMERTGAVRELTLPQHVARDGQLHDLYAYGLLRSEFEKWRKDFGFDDVALARMMEEIRAEADRKEQSQS